MQRTVKCSELRREGGREQGPRSAISPLTGLGAKPLVTSKIRSGGGHSPASVSALRLRQYEYDDTRAESNFDISHDL